jgi:hypothetical protein
MLIGTQFQGQVPAQQTLRWNTTGWADQWYVVWNLVPTTPSAAQSPQFEWELGVERTSASQLTYWITVKNLDAAPVSFEARYAILNV